jgi:hypothetical protein
MGEEKGRRTLMAKDRNRRARMRGSALDDRRRIAAAAEFRRTIRAGRRFAKAMCATTHSLVDAVEPMVEWYRHHMGDSGAICGNEARTTDKYSCGTETRR